MIWWKQFPKESRILFEFKEPADIEKFTLHSDKPFGGLHSRSECSLSIVEDENKKTFGRFSGHIQLTPGIPGTVLGKKSFCAFRSPVFRPPLNLADYIGLEMRVRTSNHGFVFNIHPDNMVPSDLFQGFIVIPHRDWATIQLPFANMAYTGYGNVDLM
ncbi:uncharacterized protein [Blastocystis hominis]|uniref:NADH:ubiquinone oxidoreductase intermediate-associated protein 30 domain-containing protein n=1 Tax=Blastocystis hominis TaxID=12968 RepID=D8LXV3_BLAHO|nr:uncharacterized protein [Blastocystis hominis]CBK20408.2 unnamed protein product [Blastocystis hominis]|eukprot:XP_012894456.1 uncharacterized protein [Blastocystis hominis]